MAFRGRASSLATMTAGLPTPRCQMTYCEKRCAGPKSLGAARALTCLMSAHRHFTQLVVELSIVSLLCM